MGEQYETGAAFSRAEPLFRHVNKGSPKRLEPAHEAKRAGGSGGSLRRERDFSPARLRSAWQRGKMEQKSEWMEGSAPMWFLYALLSAVFAALTSILAKVGIEGVNSNLATAVRTMVVVVMAWGMVFLTDAQGGLWEISRKSWVFLILSGLATGASWLCYYRALQMGEASKVVPVDKLSVVITLALAFLFLHERFTAKSLAGCALIGLGTLLMVL